VNLALLQANQDTGSPEPLDAKRIFLLTKSSVVEKAALKLLDFKAMSDTDLDDVIKKTFSSKDTIGHFLNEALLYKNVDRALKPIFKAVAALPNGPEKNEALEGLAETYLSSFGPEETQTLLSLYDGQKDTEVRTQFLNRLLPRLKLGSETVRDLYLAEIKGLNPNSPASVSLLRAIKSGSSVTPHKDEVTEAIKAFIKKAAEGKTHGVDWKLAQESILNPKPSYGYPGSGIEVGNSPYYGQNPYGQGYGYGYGQGGYPPGQVQWGAHYDGGYGNYPYQPTKNPAKIDPVSEGKAKMIAMKLADVEKKTAELYQHMSQGPTTPEAQQKLEQLLNEAKKLKHEAKALENKLGLQVPADLNPFGVGDSQKPNFPTPSWTEEPQVTPPKN